MSERTEARISAWRGVLWVHNHMLHDEIDVERAADTVYLACNAAIAMGVVQ